MGFLEIMGLSRGISLVVDRALMSYVFVIVQQNDFSIN